MKKGRVTLRKLNRPFVAKSNSWKKGFRTYIDKEYIEDALRREVEKLKASVQKTATDNESKLLGRIMYLFQGTERDGENIENDSRRQIKDLKKKLEEQEQCPEETSKQHSDNMQCLIQ